MKKLKKLIKPTIIVVITVFVTLSTIVLIFGINIGALPEQLKIIKKICSIDSVVRENSVYSKDKNIDEMLANAYINSIDDDYAFYFDKTGYEEKKNDWEGLSTKKLGVSIAKRLTDDYCTIVYVNSESPAKKEGIKSGDILISLGNKSLKGKTANEVVSIIQENESDKINIIVNRNEKELKFSVILSDFVSDSIVFRMIDNIGYIKIIEFNDATVEQFDKAYKALSEKKAKALIFDLRNNGGGTVDSCAEILDKLCPKGDLVRMKYKNGKTKVLYKSDEKQINLPMVAIVNGETASASEIFSLNIRDLNNAKLIGEKTYGKGIAQTTYDLHDGTAVKFTTATIVDKSGKTYHKVGLKPDIEVKLTKEEKENFYFLSNKEDPQLNAAIKTIKEQIK